MKLILISIGIIIFLIYTVPLIWAKINIGNIFGILLGVCLTLTGFFYDRIRTELYDNIIFKIIFIVILLLFIIFIGLFFITLSKIVIASRKTASNEKAIIILGCRVKGDIPTKALISRCNAGYEHLIENRNSIAILSGGQGKDENISEAECMKRILLSKGISENRLITEDKSTSTEENFEFSKQILDNLGYGPKIAVATNEYHIYRALLIAKKYGFKAASLPGKSIRFLRIPAFTREVFGVWFFKIRQILKK